MDFKIALGADHILKRLAEKSFRAYVAGGAVRDMISGKSPSDLDIVTDASPSDIRHIFRHEHVRTVGKSFHICLVNGVEVASFRGNLAMFPVSDLGKRDFTINSMAWDPQTRTLIDPFSGQKDLEQKIIRFTGACDLRILEDPLRMVRACRFVSQINGRLSSETVEAIKKHGALVEKAVAKERIRMEILKAMEHDQPSLFFKALHETGLLKTIFPCLDRLVDLDGGPFHGETVFEHCMIVGDAISVQFPLLRLAGFLHDAGKFDAAAEKQGRITFHGHEDIRDKIVADLLELKFSNQEIDHIDAVIRVHMRSLKEDTTPRAVRRILALLFETGVTYQEFMRIRIADTRGNLAKRPYTFGEIRTRLGKLMGELNHRPFAAFSMGDLDINGKEVMALLNIPPGPEVGRVMNLLFQRVLDDPDLNHKVKLKELVLFLKKS